MNKGGRIYIAGHKGMVGSAIWRLLESQGFGNLIGLSSQELDLRNQSAVDHFFDAEKPKYVFLAAGKVGGIIANSEYPADFLYDNLMIQSNIIHCSYEHKVTKLLFLGSSCIYPKHAPQPINESSLLTGPLEPTNEAYAIAKIAGVKMCQAYRRQYGCDFISAMPTNLYGPGDNYHPEHSHVIPGLIRRFHQAKVTKSTSVTIWGSGNPMREFMHVEDLARASLLLINKYSEDGHINVGTGEEITIRELAYLIKDTVKYKGGIEFDTTKPDGTPRKLMDSDKIYKMGFRASFGLKDGLINAYHNFLTLGDL